MSRFLRMTAVLLAITMISKLIGFIRELALLETVGISGQLDMFLLLYGISGLIMSVVGVSIMTNLTPVAHERSSPDNTLEILAEGIKVGAALTLLSWTISAIYLVTLAPPAVAGQDVFTLCAVIPVVVFFAIISEYQVAILLSRNNQFAVVCGNIIISAPLIVLMLFADIGIVTYAVGLVVSFGLRAAIFTVLIYARPSDGFSWCAAFAQPSVFRKDFISIAAGGSAMTAVNLLFLACLLVAQQMGEGQASYFGYGLKVPMLVLTSIWFVFGAQFFSEIVAAKGTNARIKIMRLTRMNILMALAAALCVSGIIMFSGLAARLPILGDSAFLEILQSSLPFLPLIIFVPIIEMLQRTLVTLKRPREVFGIAVVVGVVSVTGLSIAWFFSSPIMLVLAMSAATCMGALAGILKLRDPAFGSSTPQN